MQSIRAIHNELIEFPIFKKPDHYPIDTTQPFVRGGTYHDLITVNLISLVPNIDMGCHANKTPEDMKRWLTLARTYSTQINDEFQRQCDKQEAHLRLIENQIVKCQELTMSDINTILPDDVIRTIYEFLLPETKIQFFLAKYPLYQTAVQKKLNTKQLKILLHISNDRFYAYMSPKARQCLQQNEYQLQGRLTRYINKTATMTTLDTLFHLLKTARPETPETHHHFQTMALKLLKMMIYLGYHYKKAPRTRVVL
jgi:hypothetical protein